MAAYGFLYNNTDGYMPIAGNLVMDRVTKIMNGQCFIDKAKEKGWVCFNSGSVCVPSFPLTHTTKGYSGCLTTHSFVDGNNCKWTWLVVTVV